MRGRSGTRYSPVRRSPSGVASHPNAAPRLACVKPVASVHPEPGSNSSLQFCFFCFSFDLSLYYRPYILINAGRTLCAVLLFPHHVNVLFAMSLNRESGCKDKATSRYNPNLPQTIFIKKLSITGKGLENNGLGENEFQDGKGGERETILLPRLHVRGSGRLFFFPPLS